MSASATRRRWLLIGTVPVILAAVILLVILSSHVVGYHPYRVAGKSMAPTLEEGDRIFVDQFYYNSHPLRDGDLHTFRHGDNVILIKRITALPGETIEGRNGTLWRNGVPLKEPYAHVSTGNPIPEIESFAPRTIPKGQIFVTGDARDLSFDSRADSFHPVVDADVVGRACFIYFSTHVHTTHSLC